MYFSKECVIIKNAYLNSASHDNKQKNEGKTEIKDDYFPLVLR